MCSKVTPMMQRRSFLRGSILFVPSAVFAPITAFAWQDQPQSGSQQQPKTEDDGQQDQNDPPAREGTPAPDDSTRATDRDPSTITHQDADGLDYRECPRCGFNMYRQDRAWTCENCGYSYTE